MSSAKKVAITIVVVFAIVAAALALQVWGGRLTGNHITAAQMQSLVTSLSPQEQTQLSQNEAQKKEFATFVREVIALGQEAEKKGYDQKDPKTAVQLNLQNQISLAQQYSRIAQTKNQPPQPSDQEVKDYEKAHPAAFDDFVKTQPDLQAMPDDRRQQIKDRFLGIMLLADKAKAEKLDKDPGVQLFLRLNRDRTLASLYADDLKKNKVSDDDLKKYYEAHQADYQQVHARHILIATQPPTDEKGQPLPDAKPVDKDAARKKAEDILKQVKSGKDFAELANEYSEDPGNKQAKNGGDLGFFGKGQMVAPFEQAAFAMQPGQVSDLVESTFGFHIIKLEEKRTEPFPDVKAQLEQKLGEDNLKKQIDDIVARSGVTVDENFKVPPPAGGGAGVQRLPGGPGGGGALPPGHP